MVKDVVVTVQDGMVHLDGITKLDPQHRIVTSWPGWRYHKNTYRAPLWLSSLLPLTKPSMALKIHFAPSAKEVIDSLLNPSIVRDPRLRLVDRKPLPHQIEAIKTLRSMQNRALLYDDMGLGKSATALWALADATNVLIICPSIVKWNWLREIGATVGNDRPVYIYFAEDRTDVTTHIKASLQDGRPFYVIINYDLLRFLEDPDWDVLRAFVKTRSSAVILDESHYIKDRKAQRTKLATQLANAADSCLALTGTPIRNTVEDLYSQVEAVRPGIWSTFADFADRYLMYSMFQVGARRFQKVSGAKNHEELSAIISTMRVQRKSEEVLHLEPKIYTYPLLELDGQLKQIYEEMRKSAIYALGQLDQKMPIFDPRASSGAVAFMRCEQMAQGILGGLQEPWLKNPNFAGILAKHCQIVPGDQTTMIFPDSPKMVWIKEILGSLLVADKPVVVFSRFNAPLIWLNSIYPQSGLIYGKQDPKKNQETLAEFQGGTIPILFCQIKMAEGFNLTNCHNELFLGRDWSPAVNLQAEARCHRIGTKGTVHIQIPIVTNTMEAYIHRKLSDKSADAETVLKHVTVDEIKAVLAQ